MPARRARPRPDGLPIPKAPPRRRMKPGRYENAEHVSHLHDFCCCIAGLGECSGPVVVHHLLQPWVGIRGGSRRSDDRNTIPLCDGHHTELHLRFARDDTFFEAKTGFPEFGRRQAEELWKNSDFWECVP